MPHTAFLSLALALLLTACQGGSGAAPVSTVASPGSPVATPLPAAASAAPASAAPLGAAGNTPSFKTLQQDVFTVSCSVSGCHNAASNKGNLVLEGDGAYNSLVYALPTNDSARGAGMLRVVPGVPEISFLLRKVQDPGAGQGDPMPVGLRRLTPEQIDLLRRWIAGGAPGNPAPSSAPAEPCAAGLHAQHHVGGCGASAPAFTQPAGGGQATPAPAHRSAPTGPVAALPGTATGPRVRAETPEPGLLRLTIGPYPVPVGQELFLNGTTRLPNAEALAITAIDIRVKDGTHHFSLQKNDTRTVPDSESNQALMAFMPSDGWTYLGGVTNHSGAIRYPDGVGLSLKANQQLGYQIHAVNDRRDPAMTAEVTIDLRTTAAGALREYVGFLGMFNVGYALTPHARTQVTNTFLAPRAIKLLNMIPHYHSRGKSITVYRWDGQAVGEQVYSSADWQDPLLKIFDPPLEIAAGQGLIYFLEFVNFTDKSIFDGARFIDQEHAMLGAQYYPGPADGTPLLAVDANIANARVLGPDR